MRTFQSISVTQSVSASVKWSWSLSNKNDVNKLSFLSSIKIKCIRICYQFFERLLAYTVIHSVSSQNNLNVLLVILDNLEPLNTANT